MILITGSAGYIGSHLTTKFDRKKIDYIGIDNLKCSYIWASIDIHIIKL